MSTFVLVHGAWHGNWCWQRVRRLLQTQGHDVFTPTLTGVGERSHLLSRDVNLDTHINDVVNLIRWEELSDVILCGHSYGGCVITGVADRIPDRIRALVYLDAFVPKNGECLLDHLPAAQRTGMIEATKAAGDGWKAPPIPAEVFKVNASDAAWVNRQCTPQPLAAFEQRIALTGAGDSIENVTYIRAGEFRDGSPFGPFYERAQAQGWKTLSLACGHDVMIDLPEELAAALMAAAGATSTASAA
jgi:pimeloyl-ACP methyl ester carboxylesterase